MLRIISFILAIFSVSAFAESISQSEIVGDWEWLGNSMTQSADLSGLTGSGPSIKRFHSDGKYEYISVVNGKQKKPIVGKWEYKNDILSITRPDNGTFNKVLSYKKGVLETQDDFLEAFSYMRKK
jgi:hypothetical protein